MPVSVGEGSGRGLRDDVLGWWPEVRADRDRLPWRTTANPWDVLVSETMLAQTQVERVARRFGEVIAMFPTPVALARSEPAQILRVWSGLGYNRRALALWNAARLIVERHGGQVPRTLGELEALPGVGPYTARAVLAYGFDVRVGAVDANVARVLARAVAGKSLSRPDVQHIADRLAAGHPGREWNLALVDFGALVCRARSPRCGECPLRRRCAWHASGDLDRDPARDSALTSRPQSRFDGSDRQARGRLMSAACEGPIDPARLTEITGWGDDPDRLGAVVVALVGEGMLVRDLDGSLRLA